MAVTKRCKITDEFKREAVRLISTDVPPLERAPPRDIALFLFAFSAFRQL